MKVNEGDVPPVGTICILDDDTEFLSAQTGEVTIKKEGEKVIVVGHVKRVDNNATCITLQAINDTTCGFVTLNPDFVKPYNLDKDQFADAVKKYLSKMYPEKSVPAFIYFMDIYDGMMDGSLPIPKGAKK